MNSFWAKFAHIAAIAGQVATANHFLIPIAAQPWVATALAIAQLAIGTAQHKVNPDGTPAETAYRPPQN